MKQREVLEMFLFFQRGLVEGRSTLNTGATNPWAGLLDWSQWEGGGRQPGPSIVLPPSRSGHKPSCCHSFPAVIYHAPPKRKPNKSFLPCGRWLLPEPFFWQLYLSLQERARYQDTLPLSTSPRHNSQLIFTGFQMEARHRKLCTNCLRDTPWVKSLSMETRNSVPSRTWVFLSQQLGT